MEITALLQLGCLNLANKPLDLSGPQLLDMERRPWAGRQDGPLNSKLRCRITKKGTTSTFWILNKILYKYLQILFSVSMLCCGSPVCLLNLATLIRCTFLSRGKTQGRAQAVNGNGREHRGMGAGAAPSLTLPPSQVQADLM